MIVLYLKLILIYIHTIRFKKTTTIVIKATTSFVTERQIVNRERRSEAYSTVSYLISKLIAEAPLNIFFPSLSGAIMYKLL